MLSKSTLYEVIKVTPIASVDILYTHKNRVLLGKRNNSPAKGFLFNPGSKIQKLETITDAIQRVTKTEVGLDIDDNDRYTFIKATQHIYRDNFQDDAHGTHYISLSYKIELTDEELTFIKPDTQHDLLEWYKIDDAKTNTDVHVFCRDFLYLLD